MLVMQIAFSTNYNPKTYSSKLVIAMLKYQLHVTPKGMTQLILK